MVDNRLNNLITILKLKTFVTYQYYRKNNIYYSGTCHTNITHKYENFDTYGKVYTSIDGYDVNYILLKNVKLQVTTIPFKDNDYKEYIYYWDESEPDKNINAVNKYGLCELSIDYTSIIKCVDIYLMNKDMYDEYNNIITCVSDTKLEANINTNTIESKIFYNPDYNTLDDMYGFTYITANNLIIKNKDIRIIKRIN